MSALKLAVCSWSVQPTDPDDLVRQVRATGLSRVQLHLNPLTESDAWRGTSRVLCESEIEVVSGMVTTIGEDYTTLETIKATGGIVPDEHWPANQAVFRDAVGVAQSLGLSRVSTHIGFIPHDSADPAYDELMSRVRWIADLFDEAKLTLLFETGQETAAVLDAFLVAIDRANVGVNFDPANMILYGKGDPIEALKDLMRWVLQVHVKDATPTDTPGTWGAEVVAGTGAVDWAAFAGTLRDAGYSGDCVIEREAGEARVEDVRAAVELVTRLHG